MLECQESEPQAGQTRIYRPLKQIEPLALSLGKTRGHRTLKGPNMARGGVNSLFKKSTNSLEQEVSK